MPLNVRRFCTSVLLVFVSFVFIMNAQTAEPSPVAAVQPPTPAEVMRGRISRSKAFIAVRNYNAAVVELETIRRESSDQAVLSVVNVLLMNGYLELGDYRRAQDLLTELYKTQEMNNSTASANYVAVAGQVVKSARSRVEQYRSLGLNVTDRTLPLEALNDLEKIRETLELVIIQSKEMSKDAARMADAVALLEEAGNSRGMIARDDYDLRRWKDEVADTREMMVGPRTVVSAMGDLASLEPPAAIVATSVKAVETPPVSFPAVEQQGSGTTGTLTRDREVRIMERAAVEKQAIQTKEPANDAAADKKRVADPDAPRGSSSHETTEAETVPVIETGPLVIGSLIPYATKQAQPTYPPAARIARASGVVRVEVMIDEKGEVAEIHKASGPAMLLAAAKDAIRKWKFRPFVRDGLPTRANGFVSFNFSL